MDFCLSPNCTGAPFLILLANDDYLDIFLETSYELRC